MAGQVSGEVCECMGEVHSVVHDLMEIAERKTRVLRKKEQFLLKAQTRVMTVSPSSSAVEDVLGSIVTRRVTPLRGPSEVRADPRGLASHPQTQLKSRRKFLQTLRFITSVIVLKMED